MSAPEATGGADETQAASAVALSPTVAPVYDVGVAHINNSDALAGAGVGAFVGDFVGDFVGELVGAVGDLVGDLVGVLVPWMAKYNLRLLLLQVSLWRLKLVEVVLVLLPILPLDVGAAVVQSKHVFVLSAPVQ